MKVFVLFVFLAVSVYSNSTLAAPPSGITCKVTYATVDPATGYVSTPITQTFQGGFQAHPHDKNFWIGSTVDLDFDIEGRAIRSKAFANYHVDRKRGSLRVVIQDQGSAARSEGRAFIAGITGLNFAETVLRIPLAPGPVGRSIQIITGCEVQ